MRANAALEGHGFRLEEDPDTPGGFRASAIPNWVKPGSSTETKPYTQSDAVADALSDDPKRRQKGNRGISIFSTMAGQRAEAVENARDKVRNPERIQKDSVAVYEKNASRLDAHIRKLDSMIRNPKAFPKGTDEATANAYRAQWTQQLQDAQAERADLNTSFDKWRREFNPNDPYHFANYHNDYLNSKAAQESSVPTNVPAPAEPSAQKGSQPSMKGQWNPVTGRYE